MAATRIDIPHKLTREEVRHRMKSRIGDLPSYMPGGMATVESSWQTDDVMNLKVEAMGQTVAGTIEVMDHALRLDFTLPPALSFMRPLIERAVRGTGEQLLLK